MTRPVPADIASHPRFRELVARRNRFAIMLSACVLFAYYGFMMMVAFMPGLLRIPMGEGVTTVAWPIGAFVIVFCWLLTGWYVHRANREFDRINAQVLAEVMS